MSTYWFSSHVSLKFGKGEKASYIDISALAEPFVIVVFSLYKFKFFFQMAEMSFWRTSSIRYLRFNCSLQDATFFITLTRRCIKRFFLHLLDLSDFSLWMRAFIVRLRSFLFWTFPLLL